MTSKQIKPLLALCQRFGVRSLRIGDFAVEFEAPAPTDQPAAAAPKGKPVDPSKTPRPFVPQELERLMSRTAVERINRAAVQVGRPGSES